MRKYRRILSRCLSVSQPVQSPLTQINLPKFDDALVKQQLLALRRSEPTALSVSDLIDFAENKEIGTAQQSFMFLKNELPIRLANILFELGILPEQIQKQPSAELIYSWYYTSFKELVKYREMDRIPTDFTDTLQTIVRRHDQVVETMAHAVLEYQNEFKTKAPEMNDLDMKIDTFLDRFFMSRISIRLLINQHLTLFQDDDKYKQKLSKTRIGTFYKNANLPDIVQSAFDAAKGLCEGHYMDCPEIEWKIIDATQEQIRVFTNPDDVADDAAFSICYIPSHIHYICFEVFKNAQRATVEFHPNTVVLPKIKVQVSIGPTEVSIKISDNGGGACFSQTRKWFNYLYSTARTPDASPTNAGGTVMAGYGVGLSIARLYARYLSGDLRVQSMEGHGTDLVIYLKRSSRQAKEVIPNYIDAIGDGYSRVSQQPNSHQPQWMGGDCPH